MDIKKGLITMRQLLLFYAYMSLLFLAPSAFAYSRGVDASYYFGSFVNSSSSVTDNDLNFSEKYSKKIGSISLNAYIINNLNSSFKSKIYFDLKNEDKITAIKVKHSDEKSCTNNQGIVDGNALSSLVKNQLELDLWRTKQYPKSFCVTVKRGQGTRTFGPIVVYYRLNRVNINNFDKNSLKWNKLRGANTYRILLTKGSEFNGVSEENTTKPKCINSNCLVNEKVFDVNSFIFGKSLEAGQKYCASIRGGTIKGSSKYLAHHSDWSTDCFTVPSAVQKKPDLEVSSFSVRPQTLMVGESFTVNATVKNKGNATSDRTTLVYYHSDRNSINGGNRLALDSISSLSAGAYESESTTHPSPAVRTFYIYACVESVSNEVDPDNNCSIPEKIVTKVNPVESKPDLIMLDLTAVDHVDLGASFYINVPVKNIGIVASSRTQVRYYYSTDSQIDTSDKYLDEYSSVAALSPNDTINKKKGVRINENGIFYVGACVIPVINEQNSRNNCSNGDKITVGNNNTSKILQVPPILNLSSAYIGGGYSTRSIKLENQSDTAITVQAPTLPSGFTLTQGFHCNVIPANSDCSIAIRFTPTTVKTYSENIKIDSDASNSPARVELTGIGLQPKAASLTIRTPSHDFQSVEIGKSPAHSFDISNDGDAALTIKPIESNGEFTATHNCKNIQPRSSCQVIVTFSPITLQNHVDKPITLKSNALPKEHILYVSGSGKEKKVAKIDYPKIVSFDSVEVGKPTVKTIEITNTGNASLTSLVMEDLTNVKADVPRECATLATGAKCSVILTFTPNEVKNDSITLPFTSSASNEAGQHSILLNIQVTASPATLQLTPSELNFPNTEVQKTSVKQVFTLTNTGMQDLYLKEPAEKPEGFSFDMEDCKSLTLKENQSCDVEVSFTPTQAKVYDTTLTIKSFNAEEQVLTLKGTGIPQPTASLKVTITEANAGSIITDGGNLVCQNETCQGEYIIGSQVKITAQASDGFVFTEWSGGCVGELPETTITIDAAKNCSAVFTQLTANLILSPTTPQDFGDVTVGKASESKVFTLRNDGDADATISEYKTTKSEFGVANTHQCLDKPIAKNGGECQFEVAFTPTKGEPTRGYLTLDSSEGKLPSVELNGLGKVIDTTYRLQIVNFPKHGLVPGEKFDIKFQFVPDTEKLADGISINLKYEMSKLEALSVKTHDIFDMETAEEEMINSEEGTINFFGFNYATDIPKEPFELFSITFQVKDNVIPGDTTTISANEDAENAFSHQGEVINIEPQPISLQFVSLVNPEKLDFEVVEISKSKPMTFTLNEYNQVISINSITSNSEIFTTSSECIGNITEKCITTVTFSPVEEGDFSSSLDIKYTGSDGKERTASIELFGKGKKSAVITVNFSWNKHVAEPKTEWEVPLSYQVITKNGDAFTGTTTVKSTGQFTLPARFADKEEYCLVVKAANTISVAQEFSLSETDSPHIDIISPLTIGDIITGTDLDNRNKNQVSYPKTIALAGYIEKTILNAENKSLYGESISFSDGDIYQPEYDMNANGEISIGNHINWKKKPEDEAENEDEGDITWVMNIINKANNYNVSRMKFSIPGDEICPNFSLPTNITPLVTSPTARRQGIGPASLFTTPVNMLTAGETQTINIMLDSKEASRFLGGKLVLEFDPTMLQIIDTTVNSHFEFVALNEFNNEQGFVVGVVNTFSLSRNTKFQEMSVMSLEIKTLVEGGEKTLKFSNNTEQLITLKNYSNTLVVRDAKITFNTIDSIGDPGEIPKCSIYGIQDNGINNTQFFVMDPITRKVMTLGDEHKKADIEGMAIHPETGQLYGSSGDNTDQKGHLYLIDKETGSTTSIGATGFKEVDGIAFDPSGALWGSAVGEGLISINPDTAESELVLPFKEEIEDMVFSPDGKTLYAAQDSTIWAFDGKDINIVCSNLPNQIEALHVVPGNALMFSFHHDQRGYINVLDIDTCEVVIEQGLPTGLNDIEGLTWVPSCLTDAP